MPDQPDIAGYEQETFTHDGKTRAIYRKGSGPAVIVMAEIPGITPNVIRFADMVVDAGFTAVLPHLFGTPGLDPNAMSKPAAGRLMLSTLGPLCVNREFTMFAAGKTSPVIDWLRALSKHEHDRCGGPGVGAVGMCFTGGFALAMATEPAVLAPVLSQPSMPVPMNAKTRRSIDTSPADMEVVKARCANEDLQVLGLRFTSDKLVGNDRFPFLRDQLGDAFVAVELSDDDANPAASMAPHSVLTEHLVDEPGSATRAALDQVLDLFRRKLLVDA